MVWVGEEHAGDGLPPCRPQVASADEALSILRDGVSLRATASTALNDVSSRSHTVFTISIVQYRDGNKPVTGEPQ